jgi:acyl carrier protein
MSANLAVARQILATAVRLPESVIADDAAIGTLEAWDSLAHVRLMTALEEVVGAQLASDEIVAVAKLADVAALLARHGR